MPEKKTALDYYRLTPSMAQQIANKKGYKELVNYIGEEKNSRKLAKLNVLIDMGIIKEDEDIIYYKKQLIEIGKAYFVTRIANELTQLGLILGNQVKSIEGKKHK